MTEDDQKKGQGVPGAPISVFPVTGDNHLLAFGVSKYGKKDSIPWAELGYPHLDAWQLAKVLHQYYDFKEENIAVFVNKEIEEAETGVLEAKKQEIFTSPLDSNKIKSIIGEKVEYFENNKEKAKKDSLVVFFSGHGGLDKKTGYWVGEDGGKINLQVEIKWVLRQIMGCCAQVLLIVDCCYSGQIIEAAYDEVKGDVDMQGRNFFILTAGTKEQEVPDKSEFFERMVKELTGGESFEDFSDFHGRFTLEPMKKSWSKSFEYESQTMPRPFFLKLSDPYAPKLKSVFLESFNFFDQRGKMAIPNQRVLNLLYLHGTVQCGHHLFAKYFFMQSFKNYKSKNQSDLDIFDVIKKKKYINASETADLDNPIWSFISKMVGTPGLTDSPDIVRALAKYVAERKVVVVLLRIQGQKTNVDDKILEFWTELNQFAASNPKMFTPDQRFFLFISDERGGLLANNTVTPLQIQLNQFYERASKIATVIDFGQINPCKGNEIDQWYSSNAFLLSDFTDFINLEGRLPKIFQTDDYVQPAILKICKECSRKSVYHELFFEDMSSDAPAGADK